MHFSDRSSKCIFSLPYSFGIWLITQASRRKSVRLQADSIKSAPLTAPPLPLNEEAEIDVQDDEPPRKRARLSSFSSSSSAATMRNTAVDVLAPEVIIPPEGPEREARLGASLPSPSNGPAIETDAQPQKLDPPPVPFPQLTAIRSGLDSLLLESIFVGTDWGMITAKMNQSTGMSRTTGCYKSRWYKSRDSLLKQPASLAQGPNDLTRLSISERNALQLAKENALLLKLIYMETDWSGITARMNSATGASRSFSDYKSRCFKGGPLPDQPIPSPRDAGSTAPVTEDGSQLNLEVFPSLLCKRPRRITSDEVLDGLNNFLEHHKGGNGPFKMTDPENCHDSTVSEAQLAREAVDVTEPGQNNRMNSRLGWISAKIGMVWRSVF